MIWIESAVIRSLSGLKASSTLNLHRQVQQSNASRSIILNPFSRVIFHQEFLIQLRCLWLLVQQLLILLFGNRSARDLRVIVTTGTSNNLFLDYDLGWLPLSGSCRSLIVLRGYLVLRHDLSLLIRIRLTPLRSPRKTLI